MRVSRRVAVCLLALGAVVWSGSLMLASDGQPPASKAAAAATVTLSSALQTYCASCHNGTLRSASGLVLEKFDAERITSSPELWAKAYRQLQAGAMPPVGSPRPDRATYDAMLTSIERAWTSNAKASVATSGE